MQKYGREPSPFRNGAARKDGPKCDIIADWLGMTYARATQPTSRSIGRLSRPRRTKRNCLLNNDDEDVDAAVKADAGSG